MSDIAERLRALSFVSPPRDPKDYSCMVGKDVLGEAADEIERLRSLTEWRPIEEAPKDGRKLTMWAPGFGLGALTLYWLDGKWREPKDGCSLSVEPTHWLPLPLPRRPSHDRPPHLHDLRRRRNRAPADHQSVAKCLRMAPGRTFGFLASSVPPMCRNGVYANDGRFRPDRASEGNMSDLPRLMTLKEAAARISPALTADSLRTEAKRGRLHITRVAGKSFVTESDLREMLDRCRAVRRDQGSGSDSETDEMPCGSSSTEAKNTALVAAKETLRELKERSRATSGKSTSRRNEAHAWAK